MRGTGREQAKFKILSHVSSATIFSPPLREHWRGSCGGRALRYVVRVEDPRASLVVDAIGCHDGNSGRPEFGGGLLGEHVGGAGW